MNAHVSSCYKPIYVPQGLIEHKWEILVYCLKQHIVDICLIVELFVNAELGSSSFFIGEELLLKRT